MNAIALRDGGYIEALAPFLEDLVATVGTPRFHGALLDTADALVGSAHIAAFATVGNSRPRIILAADRAPEAVAYAASCVYVERFWQRDSLYGALTGEANLEAGVLFHLRTDSFQRLAHRKACYSDANWSRSGAQLIERVSLVRRWEDRIIRLDLYRAAERGPFDASELEGLAGCGRLMLSFIARHEAAAMPEKWTQARPEFERIIGRIAPDLSRREIEVCAGISFGLSSEAIASELNIGLNTVLTYRKRAYARLRISSHNELLRAVYAAATTIGTDRVPA